MYRPYLWSVCLSVTLLKFVSYRITAITARAPNQNRMPHTNTCLSGRQGPKGCQDQRFPQLVKRRAQCPCHKLLLALPLVNGPAPMQLCFHHTPRQDHHALAVFVCQLQQGTLLLARISTTFTNARQTLTRALRTPTPSMRPLLQSTSAA